MAQHFALADYAPKRGLRAGSPLVGSSSAGKRPNRKHIAASLLLHFLVLFGLFLLPQAPPVEVVVPLVTLRFGEQGAAGSAGGKAGGGGGGGHGTEASSAPTQQNTVEAANEPKEATSEPPTPPEPTPPEPTPTPPTQTPPTPEESLLPPAPHALAPKPKPHPHPVVKSHAVKPAPPVRMKPVETPAPPAAPTVASEPPPGPANGPGPPTQNPQNGTAATGTADAGPGGVTGVGTGAAGAGRGSFGNGKGTGDDYLDRVRKWILKYRPHPPDGLKQEKATILRIALARDGTVLDAQIVESSGVATLDQMAVDWVRRASPVPAAPPNIPGEPLKFKMPVDFRPSTWNRLF